MKGPMRVLDAWMMDELSLHLGGDGEHSIYVLDRYPMVQGIKYKHQVNADTEYQLGYKFTLGFDAEIHVWAVP